MSKVQDLIAQLPNTDFIGRSGEKELQAKSDTEGDLRLYDYMTHATITLCLSPEEFERLGNWIIVNFGPNK